MRRRQFLATTGVAVLGALAGCAHPNGSLVMTLVEDDEDLAAQYASTTDKLPDEQRALVEAVVEGERVTRQGISPPYESDRPIGYEGRYYDVTHEVIDSRPDTRYAIEVDYDPGTAAPERGEIPYANLPPADRDALRGLIPPEGESSDQGDGPDQGEGPDRGKAYVYPPDAESVLVPDQQFDVVTHEGERYVVSVGEGQSVTVRTYRYAAEEVAASAADLGSQLRDDYLFELSGLSDAEREVVAEAIDEGYYVERDPPSAFTSVLDRFREREGIDVTETDGTWIVRYEGDVYWATADFPVATEAASPTA